MIWGTQSEIPTGYFGIENEMVFDIYDLFQKLQNSSLLLYATCIKYNTCI